MKKKILIAITAFALTAAADETNNATKIEPPSPEPVPMQPAHTNSPDGKFGIIEVIETNRIPLRYVAEVQVTVASNRYQWLVYPDKAGRLRYSTSYFDTPLILFRTNEFIPVELPQLPQR